MKTSAVISDTIGPFPSTIGEEKAAALDYIRRAQSGDVDATALYMRSRSGDENSSRSAAGTVSEAGTPATLAAFTIEENTYLRNVAVLQDLLDQQEGALAPETVAQLKASLRTIDEAILEARIALARDPANKMLIEMLSGTYRQKMDLMRRTAEMTRGS
jgi:hypothetical protein